MKVLADAPPIGLGQLSSSLESKDLASNTSQNYDQGLKQRDGPMMAAEDLEAGDLRGSMPRMVISENDEDTMSSESAMEEQQISCGWHIFSENPKLEDQFHHHHSQRNLPKLQRTAVVCSVIIIIFSVYYFVRLHSKEMLHNLPLLLMILGAVIPTAIIHINDKFSRTMPRCLASHLKKYCTGRHLQFLISIALSVVASAHALRATLDPRTPIHYAFELTWAHVFYTALMGCSGFLTFPYFVFSSMSFTIMHLRAEGRIPRRVWHARNDDP